MRPCLFSTYLIGTGVNFHSWHHLHLSSFQIPHFYFSYFFFSFPFLIYLLEELFGDVYSSLKYLVMPCNDVSCREMLTFGQQPNIFKRRAILHSQSCTSSFNCAVDSFPHLCLYMRWEKEGSSSITNLAAG